MLMKNKYQSHLAKMQPTRPHYSIRKFAAGAASVLIGLTFLGLDNQVVKADVAGDGNNDDSKAPASEQSNAAASTGTPEKVVVTTDSSSEPKQDDSVASSTPNTDSRNAESDQGNHVDESGTQKTAPTTSLQDDISNGTGRTSEDGESQPSNDETHKEDHSTEDDATSQDLSTLKANKKAKAVSSLFAQSLVQEQGKAVAKDDYTVTEHNLTPHDGENNKAGYVQLDVGLKITNTKNIESGDYIDIDFGAPLTDGSQRLYSDFLDEQETPVEITDNQGKKNTIGSINVAGPAASSYYRLTFNQSVQNYDALDLNISLKNFALDNRAITLVGYTNNADGPTSYQPKDDIVIGDGAYTYTSGLSVPVEYKPTNIQPNTRDSKNETWAQSHSSKSRVWNQDANGKWTVNDHSSLGTGIVVYFSNQMTNSVDVTVATPINDYFKVHYETVDEVRNQIINAFKKLHQENLISANAQDNSGIGFTNKVVSTESNLPQVKVTITVNPNTTSSFGKIVGGNFVKDNSIPSGQLQSKTYHISLVGGNLGDIFATPITFVTQTTKAGVNVSKPANITTPDQDSPKRLSSSYKNAPDEFYNGWISKLWCDSIPIKNGKLMNYISSHLAAWVKVQSGQEDPSQHIPEGPVHYIFNAISGKQSSSPVNTAGGISIKSGHEIDPDNPDQQISTKVIYWDQDENKSLKSVPLSGKVGSASTYTTVNDIHNFEEDHYVLVKDPTHGKVIQFDTNTPKEYKILFNHQQQTLDPEAGIATREIDYVDDQGNPVNGAPDGRSVYTEKVDFIRQPVKDLVTNTIGYDIDGDGKIDTTNGTLAWKATGSNTFAAVTSKNPSSLGYQNVNYLVVPEQMASSEMVGHTQKVKVIYSKNAIPAPHPQVIPDNGGNSGTGGGTVVTPSGSDTVPMPSPSENDTDSDTTSSEPVSNSEENQPTYPNYRPKKNNHTRKLNYSDSVRNEASRPKNVNVQNINPASLRAAKASKKLHSYSLIDELNSILPNTSANETHQNLDIALGAAALSLGAIGLAGVKHRHFE